MYRAAVEASRWLRWGVLSCATTLMLSSASATARAPQNLAPEESSDNSRYAALVVDVNSGAPRMTFGIADINDGISFVPIAIGLFGIAEMIHNLERPQDRDFVGTRISNLVPTSSFRWRTASPCR